MSKKSPVLRLKKSHEQRARTHPWIFKGDVADVSDVAPGDVVTVIDASRRFVGRGLFNPRPALCCRIFTWEDEPLDDAWLARRIEAAVHAREGSGREAERYFFERWYVDTKMYFPGGAHMAGLQPQRLSTK